MNANVSLKVSNIKEFLARSIIVRNQVRDAELQEALHWIKNIKPFFCHVCRSSHCKRTRARLNRQASEIGEPLKLCMLCKEHTCGFCLTNSTCDICAPGPCGYCGIQRANDDPKYDFCTNCGCHTCGYCLLRKDNRLLCPDCCDD